LPHIPGPAGDGKAARVWFVPPSGNVRKKADEASKLHIPLDAQNNSDSAAMNIFEVSGSRKKCFFPRPSNRSVRNRFDRYISEGKCPKTIRKED